GWGGPDSRPPCPGRTLRRMARARPKRSDRQPPLYHLLSCASPPPSGCTVIPGSALWAGAGEPRLGLAFLAHEAGELLLPLVGVHAADPRLDVVAKPRGEAHFHRLVERALGLD